MRLSLSLRCLFAARILSNTPRMRVEQQLRRRNTTNKHSTTIDKKEQTDPTRSMKNTNEPFLSNQADDERARLLNNNSSQSQQRKSGEVVVSDLVGGPKSLFFCLVLDNPFDPENEDKDRVVDQRMFVGEAESADCPPTALSDDEFLLEPPKKKGFMKTGSDGAPNKFQKVIEIILRMQARGIDFIPSGMIRPSSNANVPNHFCGYELVQENLFSSPDGDEMYVKIHMKKNVMLAFAESQGVVLNTHPYAYSGGAPMPYSQELDKKLSASVELFAKAFPEHFEDDDEETTSFVQKKKKYDGFVLDVPDKMRLLVRMMREPWKYGGCGIQIAEMKRHGVLVRHFFPLHNPAYQSAYHLNRWASFKQMFTRDPLFQVEEHVVKYFGEEVALYFIWIKKYTLFLRLIAIPGCLAAVLGYASKNNSNAHQYFPISLVNGIFSGLCVVWGIAWNFHWLRYESTFATKYGQEAQMRQEMVRDEFEMEKEAPVTIPDVYKCHFPYPLTLRNKPDGSMVDLHYSETRRALIRYGVSYPCILLLAGAMVTALIYNTIWRFTDPENPLIQYGSSIATVAIGFVFGVLFEKIVPSLNAWENNRTDSEETAQSISKSFLFYFLSYYFALFCIAVWPTDNATSDNSRLDQLAAQMIIITLVKPMVQNAQELAMPWINAELRRRTDVYGSSVKAICSLLCCRKMEEPDMSTLTIQEMEGRKLWLETQMEPYESTSGDYLEITLQYGYMTMFAATFPLATVAAFFYNVLEMRVDARKLIYECQRPVAQPAVSIGAWNGIFFFLSALSVITNSFLTAVVSPFNKQLKLSTDDTTKFKTFSVFQYVLVVGFFLAYIWQGGQSVESLKTKAKHFILQNKGTRLRFEKAMKEATTHA